MATTTNYSFPTPDDTDLVKDGASAIRSFGTAVDTQIKDLNPGTTAGDIDYYTTSTAKARVGIGTAGQVLVVNAGATAPEWATPASSIPANDGATVSTTQSTNSTSYTDLATAGPAVTVTTGTKVLVIISAKIEATGSASSIMSFAISGATTSSASDARSITASGFSAVNDSYSRAQVITVTAGSNTFTAKYRVTSGTKDFSNRDIFVMTLN